jgi:excisionase family DNA binding protein
MDKDFFSIPEAAKILHISRIALFNKVKAGKIKATKVGRNFIIQKKDLAEATGESLSETKKKEIDKAVDKAVKEYGETFKRLGKE